MPEDTLETDDRASRPGDPELVELRRAALQLARKLGSYGAARMDDID